MKPRTLAGLMRERASVTPDRVAIRFKQGAEWPSWTFRQYWSEARRAAAGLAMRGICPGDRVLLLVPEMQPAVRSLFGIWTLGATPTICGVPYRLTDLQAYLDHLQHIAGRLQAKAMIISASLASLARAPAKLPLVVAEELDADPAASPANDPDLAPGPALIQLTSGTTGRARGVIIPHDRLMLHMESMSQALPSPAHAAAVSWLPLHHDMGLLGGLLFPFWNGYTAHMLSPADFRSRPSSWLEAMSQFRATICAAPPSAYAMCLPLAARARAEGWDLSVWECAMVGAEPVSARVLRAFAEQFAPCGFRAEAFFPVYGLAEATVAVTFPDKLAATVVDRVDRRRLAAEGRAIPCSDDASAQELVGLGRPIPHTRIQIVDEAGQPVGERIVGEIWVRSATLMEGYHGEPEATAEVLPEAIVDGWLRTGDLGYLASGVLFVTGRKKEIIIKGGHNYSPAELEELCAEVDGVRAGCVAAVGIRAESRETELIYLVAETRLASSEHSALSERIRARLRAVGLQVDHVMLVAPGTLPKTTSGKIQRLAVAKTISVSPGGR